MPGPESRRTFIQGDAVFTVRELLSAVECADLIDLSESTGYEAATVNTLGGHRRLPDWRNNDRVMRDDPERAEMLWDRIVIEGCKYVLRTDVMFARTVA